MAAVLCQWQRIWFILTANLLLLPLLLLFPTSSLAGGPVDANLSEKVALENEIQTLKNYLERYKDSNRNLGSQYARLGFLYQSSDVRWHNGGKYKPFALESLNKALTYDLSDTEKILILQRKGMLLKMMSKGPEAVETHQQVLNMVEVSDEDASEACVHMADAQSMMGQVSEALESLSQALKFNPNNLEVYYPMVQACKELKCKSVEEWGQLVQEMERALSRSKNPTKKQKSRRSKNIQIDFNEDDDDDDDWSDSPSLSTGIYWALYEAGLKAGSLSSLPSPLISSFPPQRTSPLPGHIWISLIAPNSRTARRWDPLPSQMNLSELHSSFRSSKKDFGQVALVLQPNFQSSLSG
jgi:tetratricopeptide (TPR) repeat protein